MAKKSELFDEKEDVKIDEELSEVEDVVEPDDLEEGFIAEHDPASRIPDFTAKYKGEAEDVVKTSLDGQLTQLGRETAKKLDDYPKYKVVIPIKELAPDDKFVVVGTNGWNTQILRDKPVMLPDVIIDRLAKAGENPTLVR